MGNHLSLCVLLPHLSVQFNTLESCRPAETLFEFMIIHPNLDAPRLLDDYTMAQTLSMLIRKPSGTTVNKQYAQYHAEKPHPK